MLLKRIQSYIVGGKHTLIHVWMHSNLCMSENSIGDWFSSPVWVPRTHWTLVIKGSSRCLYQLSHTSLRPKTCFEKKQTESRELLVQKLVETRVRSEIKQLTLIDKKKLYSKSYHGIGNDDDTNNKINTHAFKMIIYQA